MKITVVIVSYNVKFYLQQCLDSLLRALQGIESEVFVVDNHSKDGSVDYLSKRFPGVNVIDSPHNLGFARANNLAIRKSHAEYVLLLNPDTVVGESTIRTAIDFMDAHEDAGSLGVRMLDASGKAALESRRGLPSPMVAFYKMVGLCARFPNSHRFGHYYMSALPWDEPGRIEVVSGAFCLLRKKAIDEVGYLDEDFFMYGEDIDLSYRILKGGYHNYYLPSTILHYKGESTQKSSFRYVHVFYEAMLIFFRKHYSGMSFLLSLPIKTAIYGKALVALVGMLSDRMRKSLGFFSPSAEGCQHYVFVGSQKMLDACREISRRLAFDAEFYTEVETVTWDVKKDNVLVLDAGQMSYAEMLQRLSLLSDSNVSLGTYSEENGKIITASEILG